MWNDNHASLSQVGGQCLFKTKACCPRSDTGGLAVSGEDAYALYELINYHPSWSPFSSSFSKASCRWDLLRGFQLFISPAASLAQESSVFSVQKSSCLDSGARRSGWGEPLCLAGRAGWFAVFAHVPVSPQTPCRGITWRNTLPNGREV